MQRHLARNLHRCLPHYSAEELLNIHKIPIASVEATRTGLSSSAPGSNPRPQEPSSNSPHHAPKRQRMSTGGAEDDGDLGGFQVDDDDDDDDPGGDSELPSPSDGGGAAAATGDTQARSRDQPPSEPVLLYDVLRSRRVDELLKCFESEPPYKPVEVSHCSVILAL